MSSRGKELSNDIVSVAECRKVVQRCLDAVNMLEAIEKEKQSRVLPCDIESCSVKDTRCLVSIDRELPHGTPENKPSNRLRVIPYISSLIRGTWTHFNVVPKETPKETPNKTLHMSPYTILEEGADDTHDPRGSRDPYEKA